MGSRKGSPSHGETWGLWDESVASGPRRRPASAVAAQSTPVKPHHSEPSELRADAARARTARRLLSPAAWTVLRLLASATRTADELAAAVPRLKPEQLAGLVDGGLVGGPPAYWLTPVGRGILNGFRMIE